MLNRSLFKTYSFLGFFLLIILFLHYLGPLKTVESTLRQALNPLLSYFTNSNAILTAKWQLSTDQDVILANLNNCQQNLQNQDLLKSQLKILTDENSELKTQINFKNRTTFTLVPANIIGRELNNRGQILIINRGSNDNITLNNSVIVGDGLIIGKIFNVNNDISYVRLISDNNNKLAATILNRERSVGVVEGGFGLSLRMNFIPRNEIVKVGDQVITSGLEEGTPRGLLIGTVAVVENEAYKPFQQAILTPNASIDKLSLVSVITN